MSTYFKILLVLHIGGAIIGIGPTFAYSVLGPFSGKAGPAGGLAIMEAMVAIERRLVTPVALVIQPASGALLIFESGRNHAFFEFEWLYTSIILYAVILYVAYFVNNPALEKMIKLAKGGEGETPAFAALVKRTQVAGPFLTVLAVIIVFLMIWKPGQ